MKPEDAKRLTSIRINGSCECHGTSICDGCFLLRVIDERGKEIKAKEAKIKLLLGQKRDLLNRLEFA